MITNQRKTFTLTGFAVILAIVLGACAPSATPAPTADVSVFYTQAAATIMAGLTQTAIAMPSATLPPPTATPQPSPTAFPTSEVLIIPTQTVQAYPTGLIPTPLPVDAAAAHGCYNATLVADVTIKYAPAFKPGDKFTKTWRIKNTGSCDWPRSFLIAFTSGDPFGASSTTINQIVLTGATTDISIAMIAPNLKGVVYSNWQLSTNIGKTFGSVLSTSITLPVPSASTPTSGGCLNSALISDVTVPSGTILKAGENFTKSWSIKNIGTCEWNANFKITFVGGDVLGSDTTKIRQKVGPGASATISLPMIAPTSPGTVSSSWQLASDAGTLFGQQFVFSIEVK